MSFNEKFKQTLRHENIKKEFLSELKNNYSRLYYFKPGVTAACETKKLDGSELLVLTIER